jgi:tetratricopeptide (TPR) repeat protein
LAWVRLGNGERAGEDIEKAIALAPDDAEAYFTRAEMHRHTAARRQQVIADYGKAFALKPDYAGPITGRGHCCSIRISTGRRRLHPYQANRIGGIGGLSGACCGLCCQR